MHPFTPEEMVGYQVHVLGIVDRVGWAVQGIIGEGHSNSFAYTVGLGQQRGYEFVLVGLPMDITQQLLNDLVMRDRDTPIADGEPFADLIANDLRTVIQPMPSTRGFGVATSLFGYEWRARQLLWPDTAGILPTDPACHSGCVAAQLNDDLDRWCS